MPQTFQEYPIREVLISGTSRRPFGAERMQEGDIITIRKPAGGCGSGAMSVGIWLWVQGPDTSVLDRFKDMITTETDEVDGLNFEKRRFQIPLNRLPENIDLARVRNPSDRYQPFLLPDWDTGRFLTEPSPLPVVGLVFDKQTMRFL